MTIDPDRQQLPMKVFFDTEFTGLGSDPRLLSIGMVAEDGSELYFEFSDGWTEDKCSSWVRVNVLPMLGKADQLSRSVGAERIVTWLSGLGALPILMGDSDWDTELLRQLLDEYKADPTGYCLELLKFKDREQAGLFESARKRYFASESVKPHHALTDAKAFRVAYEVAFNRVA